MDYRYFLSLLLLAESALLAASEPLMHSAVLDQEGAFIMRWTPNSDYIVIEMEAKTRGYLGIGFSPNGGMKGSDIIIGGIDESGRPYFSDRHATGESSPLVDDSQDAELLSAYRNSSHTTIRFRRAWSTCDDKNDMKLTTDTTRVIYAYNESPPDPREETLPYHTKRGMRSLYLMEPKFTLPSEEDDVEYWDVRSPNVSLPDDLSTLYWCSVVKVKDLKEKNHFIGYKPLLEPTTSKYVHHMILYECHLKDSSTILDPWLGHSGAQCYSPNMPISWQKCTSPLIIWAVGAEGGNFPPNVGFPVGEEYDGSTYFLLEIHYNNPEKDYGVVDSSGLRVFHTTKLRQHDAGMLEVGQAVSPFHIIGPGMSDWKTVAHCSADCTKKSLPLNGMKVFAGILHSHVLGRSITLQHIRSGKELPPILEDHSYDFNYQQERHLAEERVILRGDHLITTCHYNTKHKSETVFGGFGTEEEMCLVFLMYYPQNKFINCLSRPDINELMDAAGIDELYGSENTKFIRNGERINMDQEKALRDKLISNKAGEGGVPLHISESLNTIIVKKPESLQNRTVLAILQDPKLWTETDTPNKMQTLAKNGSYQLACVNKGRKQITLMKDKQTPPDFEVFKPIEEPCFAKLHPLQSAGLIGEPANGVQSVNFSLSLTSVGIIVLIISHFSI